MRKLWLRWLALAMTLAMLVCVVPALSEDGEMSPAVDVETPEEGNTSENERDEAPRAEPQENFGETDGTPETESKPALVATEGEESSGQSGNTEVPVLNATSGDTDDEKPGASGSEGQNGGEGQDGEVGQGQECTEGQGQEGGEGQDDEKGEDGDEKSDSKDPETCEHAEKIVAKNWRVLYREISDDVHEKVNVEFAHYYCPDCGTDLLDDEWKTGEEESLGTEAHTYDSDGFCTLCFHPCNHSREHETNARVTTSYKTTASTHTEVTKTTYDVVCDICGKVYKDETRTETGDPEAHEFDAWGVCEICGYRKAAKPSYPSWYIVDDDEDEDDDDDEDYEERHSRDDDDDEDDRDAEAQPVETEALPVIQVPPSPAEGMDLVETMRRAGVRLQGAADRGATVEVANINQLLVDSELERLQTLPVSERLLVALVTLGFENQVQDANLAANGVLLGNPALDLIDAIQGWMNALSPIQQAAFEQLAKQWFPEAVDANGTPYTSFVIELVITENGGQRRERYSFLENDGGEWVLEQMTRN